MKSKLEDVLPKLHLKYSNISPDLINDLVDIYFLEGKEAIKSMVKPEIAFMWGTLRLNFGKVNKELRMLNTILKNRDTAINTLTKEELEQKEIKRDKLQEMFTTHLDRVKKGKIKRKYNKQNKHETKSDQPK